jgi:hypothetical protein
LTSGLLLLAKNPESADRISQQIQSSTVRKEYIAKVVGNFPEYTHTRTHPIAFSLPHIVDLFVSYPQHNISFQFEFNLRFLFFFFISGYLEVDQPIAPHPSKREIQIVSSKVFCIDLTTEREKRTVDPLNSLFLNIELQGKPSRTGFEKIKTLGGEYSIVKCIPFTGRTHQIRVHLQYLGILRFVFSFSLSESGLFLFEWMAIHFLGFPIVNDPLYNPHSNHHHRISTENENDTTECESYPLSSSRKRNSDHTHDPNNENVVPLSISYEHHNIQIANNNEDKDKDKDEDEDLIGDCIFCKMRLSDPTPEENFICLHAYSYKSIDPNNLWEFKTDMPSWSN